MEGTETALEMGFSEENTARNLTPSEAAPDVPRTSPSNSMILNLVAEREQLLSLMKKSPELQVSLDLYGISELALSQLTAQIGTRRVALWMDSGQVQRPPVLIRSHGIKKQWAKAIGTACGIPILWHLRTTERIWSCADFTELIGPAPMRIIEESGIAIFAPVVAKRKVFGFIGLGSPDDRESFDEVDLRVLNASMGMLGVALENTGMYNRLLEKHRQLTASNEGLRELDRLKNEFVSNVNHELKTPLTIILAYLDMLMEEDGAASPRSQYLKTMFDESQKLKSLIEKLLDFSNVADDRPGIEMLTGDVVSAVRACFQQRLPGVAGGLRELSFGSEDALPEVRFDPVGVQQILEVLIDNAVKFTPQGSQISIRIRRWESGMRHWVRVDVEDDGPGIMPDRLATIFDSFRQGDGSSTRQFGGMGLGLAYAYKLAARMGGELMVDEDPRQGALFSLLLPAAGK